MTAAGSDTALGEPAGADAPVSERAARTAPGAVALLVGLVLVVGGALWPGSRRSPRGRPVW
jgi:hypothetical protein